MVLYTNYKDSLLKVGWVYPYFFGSLDPGTCENPYESPEITARLRRGIILLNIMVSRGELLILRSVLLVWCDLYRVPSFETLKQVGDQVLFTTSGDIPMLWKYTCFFWKSRAMWNDVRFETTKGRIHARPG